MADARLTLTTQNSFQNKNLPSVQPVQYVNRPFLHLPPAP